MDLIECLARCPVVAILRGIKPDEALSIGEALEEQGVAIMEVPLNSPDPLRTIEILAATFGDRMLVGAGTVTDPKQVAEISAAGGKLIVTPHADTAIVRAAKSAGLIAAPGFCNPTEAFALLQAGADALKLFPAEVFGIPMMKALQAVLPPTTGIIPVGGVDSTNVAQWLNAGAVGVGTASSIYRPGDDHQIVRLKAKLLIEAAQGSSVTTPPRTA
jgi:2-dehydro-3-deoxyphosphogalactonate aldolase